MSEHAHDVAQLDARRRRRDCPREDLELLFFAILVVDEMVSKEIKW